MLRPGMAAVFAPIQHWLDVNGWTEMAWFWPVLLFGLFLGFALTLHSAMYKKQTWTHRLILASAGMLLACSLIFFSHTLFEIPYTILWSFFLLTPIVGIGEIYFSRGQSTG